MQKRRTVFRAKKCELNISGLTYIAYLLEYCRSVHISISYSLSRISRALPSSITFVRSLSFNWRSVFETTPILISIPLISFFTVVMAFLMFVKGVLSENCFPVSSILRVTLPSLSLISYNSVSKFSTFLLTVVKLFWISLS